MSALHDIETWLGLTNPSGSWYAFWSGIGSDITEVAVIGAVVQYARHANCHQKGCWRLGFHRVGDSPYKVCSVHHPDMQGRNVSAAHLHARHHDWRHRTKLGTAAEPEAVVVVDETAGDG